METLNISLSAKQKAFVDAEVAKQGLASTTEYIRHLIRQAEAQRQKARLEKLLLEGLASGPATPFTAQDWQDIERAVFADETNPKSKQRSQKP